MAFASSLGAGGIVNPFGYDALGRLITQGQTDFYYDGSKVVEQRDSGVVTAQYVWAPDGTLILRDRHLAATNGGNPSTLIPNPSGTALNERIYALTDPSGSTIAIAAIYGAVLERYVYDSNGQPQPLTPAWGAYATTLSSTGTDQYSSLYNWIYLYHGARWLALFTSYTTSFGYGASTTYLGGGLNEYGGGSTWVSSYDGRPVQPSLAAEISGGNAYDPTPFALKATIVGLQVGIAGAGIAAGFATGGIAAIGLAYFGVGVAATSVVGAAALAGTDISLSAGGTLAAAAIGGGLSGFGMGAAQGATNTGTVGGAWSGAWRGAAAGVAGGLVGAGAGIGLGALGVTCQNLGGLAAGTLRGAAEGAAGGYAGGFVQGGLDTGTLQGALDAGATGALAGAAIGGGIGACLQNACFAAGTPIFLAEKVTLPDGSTMAVVAGSLDAEQIREGHLLLSGSEFDPSAPLAAKVVEEVFVRAALILVVHVGGREIRTTAEHEFMVRDKGRVPAADLEPGDLLPGHTGGWTPVEKTVNTGKVEPVYNYRVADYHTYFVGRPEWGFSVWVHNTYISKNGLAEMEEAGLTETAAGVEDQPAQSSAEFPTDPGGTGPRYDEANGQGVYVLRDGNTIRYVGRGDAPSRLLAHATPGSGNDDLVGQILFDNNLPAAQAVSLENELMHVLGGPKSVNPGTPLRNGIQGVGEASNPAFTDLEFAANDDLLIEAMRRANLL